MSVGGGVARLLGVKAGSVQGGSLEYNNSRTYWAMTRIEFSLPPRALQVPNLDKDTPLVSYYTELIDSRSDRIPVRAQQKASIL